MVGHSLTHSLRVVIRGKVHYSHNENYIQTLPIS